MSATLNLEFGTLRVIPLLGTVIALSFDDSSTLSAPQRDAREHQAEAEAQAPQPKRLGRSRVCRLFLATLLLGTLTTNFCPLLDCGLTRSGPAPIASRGTPSRLDFVRTGSSKNQPPFCQAGHRVALRCLRDVACSLLQQVLKIVLGGQVST
jgi:hypothetical protein